jgi:general secretion pathway protein L
VAKSSVSTILRVFVGESWPEHPATRWVQIDAAGEVLQRGESDALRWPAADYCEAVISAPEVSWLSGTVPPGVSRRDLPQIIAGVIEDQLLDDPDRCHLTVCSRNGNAAQVLVVSRARLRNVITQFAALNRPLAAAFSELEVVSVDPTGWTVALAADAAILARPSMTPLVLDVSDDGTPPELLVTLIADDPKPATITIRPETGKKVDLTVWKERLKADGVRIGADHCWHAVPRDATDLLHGEFASREKRNNWWLIIKPAIIVAAAAMVAYLAVGLAQIAYSSYKISRAESRISELFSAAFPGVPAVAPIAQTRRNLDQLRSSHGLARSDDALVLLAAVADAVGAEGADSMHKLTYSNRQLTVFLEPAMAGRIEDLKRSLVDQGFQVDVKGSEQNNLALLIKRDMTR